MSAADPIAAGQDVWQPKGNPWIIAVAVSLAAFMEVLDTSVANVALPHIAGNLGAVLSYVDAYWLLSACSALMFFSSFLLKKNEPGKSGHVSVH